MDLSGLADTLGTVAQGVNIANQVKGLATGVGKSGSQSTSGPTTLQAMDGEDDAAIFQMFLDKYLEGIQQSYVKPVNPVM